MAAFAHRLGRLLACSALFTGIFGAIAADEPLTAAWIYIGPVGDHGWTFAHDESRKAAEAKAGGKLKTSYIENVPETADSERVIRELAQKGTKVIFATSFGYMNQMEKVAKAYPKTIFMHATGYKTGPNMGTYDVRTYEGAYLLGVIAGKTTKTGKLGVVASIPIPEVIRNIDAFEIGARSVNPTVTTRAIWVNSWFDPGKEREAALALIAQGCDVLMQNTDSPAVVQTALEKGVHAFGWDSDMSKFGGKAHLAASELNWSGIYTDVTNDVAANKWQSKGYWWGVKEGAVEIAHFGPDTPPAVRKLVEERVELIKAGKLHPFAGPIKDQSGKEFVAMGKTLDDGALHGMNTYVEGVEGSIPK